MYFLRTHVHGIALRARNTKEKAWPWLYSGWQEHHPKICSKNWKIWDFPCWLPLNIWCSSRTNVSCETGSIASVVEGHESTKEPTKKGGGATKQEKKPQTAANLIWPSRGARPQVAKWTQDNYRTLRVCKETPQKEPSHRGIKARDVDWRYNTRTADAMS